MTTVKELKETILTYRTTTDEDEFKKKISDLESHLFDESKKSYYVYSNNENTKSKIHHLLTAYEELETENKMYLCRSYMNYYIDTVEQKRQRVKYLHEVHNYYKMRITKTITENGKQRRKYKTEEELDFSLADIEQNIFMGNSSITEIKQLLQECMEDEIDINEYVNTSLTVGDFKTFKQNFYVFSYNTYDVMFMNKKTLRFVVQDYDGLSDDTGTDFSELNEDVVEGFKKLKAQQKNKNKK